MKNRRELTAEERAAARRLSDAWALYKAQNPGATQEWLGKETGLGSQGAVGQYLRGAIPLNLKALFAFCRVLAVDPMDIGPQIVAGAPAEIVAAAMKAGIVRNDNAWPFSFDRVRYDRMPESQKRKAELMLLGFIAEWEEAHPRETRRAG
ncbi:hypothetical protein [Paraburkholderia caballeronis]|uniref:hypothetical protein n=1 Tax=Paraburkholderia caballeronis TaxID=416943 RepID=UPI001066CEC0|nr:hypothetical protein [Paraburkholderia caballeronis]